MPSLFPSPQDFRDTLRANFPDLPDIDEPGFASTYDHSALKEKLWQYSPVAMVGGLGAALWYANRAGKPKPAPQALPKKQPKKQPPALEKAAAPDIKKLIENIRWHLPKLRLPDTVAGSLVGAGAGGLYDLVRGRGRDGKRKTVKRVLTGALTGAGLANVIGDRFRRYVSNTKLPLGYSSNAASEIKPSLKRVWNAAILDKQDFDPKTLEYWRGGAIDMTKFLPARYEIVRRQFGLPVDQKNPWWQKNPEGYYSLNEKSPDYAQRLALLFGSRNRDGIERSSWLFSGPEQILKNPEKALPAFSKYPLRQGRDFNFFGATQLFGGMHLPYIKNPDGSYSGMAIDRWDLTHNKAEAEYFKKNLWRTLTDSKWRQAPLRENLSWYIADDDRGHTNSSAMKALGGRLIWDNILSGELPWIAQKFKVAPNPAPRPLSSYALADYGRYAPNTLQFLKSDNAPATPAMDFEALDAWDKK
jgi:hypothetical protein